MYMHRVSRRYYTLIFNRVVADFVFCLSMVIADLAKAKSGSTWEHAAPLQLACVYGATVT
jgi:hypothetical protein